MKIKRVRLKKKPIRRRYLMARYYDFGRARKGSILLRFAPGTVVHHFELGEGVVIADDARGYLVLFGNVEIGLRRTFKTLVLMTPSTLN